MNTDKAKAEISSNAMTISFTCPDCDRPLKVKDELAGGRIKCPECGETIKVQDSNREAFTSAARSRRDELPVEKEQAGRALIANDYDETARNVGTREKAKKRQLIRLCVSSGILFIGITALILVFRTNGSNAEWLVGDWIVDSGLERGEIMHFGKDGNFTNARFRGMPVPYSLVSATELEIDNRSYKIEMRNDELLIYSPQYKIDKIITVYKRLGVAPGGIERNPPK